MNITTQVNKDILQHFVIALLLLAIKMKSIQTSIRMRLNSGIFIAQTTKRRFKK